MFSLVITESYLLTAYLSVPRISTLIRQKYQQGMFANVRVKFRISLHMPHTMIHVD